MVGAAIALGISRFDLGENWWWVVPAVVATAWLLAWATPGARRALPPAWAPGLVAAATAATYACVPETDHLSWIAVFPLTLTGIEAVRRKHLPAGWILGAALVVLAAGTYGATGRSSAIVGALFAWWPLVVVGLLARWEDRPLGWLAAALITAPLVLATLLVARTGALEPTIRPALVAVAITAPTSLAVSLPTAWVVRRRSVQRTG